MTETRVEVPYGTFISTHGNYNANLSAFALPAVLAGVERNTNMHTGKTVFKFNSAALTLAEAKWLVGEGATVYTYPAFIKIADVDADVPEGVPGREVEGDILTWAQWKPSNYTFMEGTDGNFYLGIPTVKLNDYVTVFDDLVDATTYDSLRPGTVE